LTLDGFEFGAVGGDEFEAADGGDGWEFVSYGRDEEEE
jgi:hypothetical protein